MRSSFSLSRLLVVLSTLALLSACSGANPEAVPQQASSADVNVFLRDVLAVEPVLAYEDLVTRLGPPVRVSAEPVGASARPDTLRTLFYHGLEVALREAATAPSRVAFFALTGARYTSPEGLRVGYAEPQVIQVLGMPPQQESTQWLYEKEDPRSCVLVLFMEQKSISRMEWRFIDP